MKRFSSSFFLGAFFLAAVSFGAASAHAAPVISSITPRSGSGGTSVTIAGSGFSDTAGDRISLGKYGNIGFVSSLNTPNGQIISDAKIVFTMPSAVVSVCSPLTAPCATVTIGKGLYLLTVSNSSGKSKGIPFTVTSPSLAAGVYLSDPAGTDPWIVGSHQSVHWKYSAVSAIKKVTLSFIDSAGAVAASASVSPYYNDPITQMTEVVTSKSLVVPALTEGDYFLRIDVVSQKLNAAAVSFSSRSTRTVHVSPKVVTAPVLRPKIALNYTVGIPILWQAGSSPAIGFTVANATSGTVDVILRKGTVATYSVATGVALSDGRAVLNLAGVPAGTYLITLKLTSGSKTYLSPAVSVKISAAAGAAPVVVHNLPASNSTKIDGSVDSISCGVISGWTCDGGTHSIIVQAYDEKGHIVGSHLASISRPDVTASGRCGPTDSKFTKTGFSFPFPSWDKDGKPHIISLFGVEYGSAGKLRGLITPLSSIVQPISCSFGSN